MTRRVAIVGAGIGGLATAHHLAGAAEVSLFEAGDYFGGHTHTVDVRLPTRDGVQSFGVDTGFLVYNERTYPGLIALFAALGVPTAKTDMSFSVQTPHWGGSEPLEWNGANLNTVFAQRSNLLKPRFWRMLREVLRFNRVATDLALRNQDHELQQPLEDFLQQYAFGPDLREGYLLPMLGCIWSCPTDQMLRFPVATMIRFCHNHGLLQVEGRPQWYTVAGGARQYVEKILRRVDHAHVATPVERITREADGVTVHSRLGAQRFDQLVLACHPDQALAMLAQPSPEEARLLGAIRYHDNRAVLHTDASVMPKRRLAWAAWNYERASAAQAEAAHVCLHYWLNQLQPLPFTREVFVSLNPLRPIAEDQVIDTFSYAHPVFDLAAIAAQTQLAHIQGTQRTWYAGAWLGYGFHEDGYQAGRRAAEGVLRA